MFAESVIDEYNNIVEKKCLENMKKNKEKSKRDYLSTNRVFNKEMGGFITPKLITEKVFKNVIKNSYNYLGEKIPSEAVLEDLWVKGFNRFTTDEFAEYIDLVQSGNFVSIGETFNSFIKELADREATASMGLSTPSIEVSEDLSVQLGQGGQFENVYPIVGSEAEYGFAPSGKGTEMSETMRSQQERLRTQMEAKAGDRPVPQSNILTGARGRPANINIDNIAPPTLQQLPSGGSSVS